MNAQGFVGNKAEFEDRMTNMMSKVTKLPEKLPPRKTSKVYLPELLTVSETLNTLRQHLVDDPNEVFLQHNHQL